MVVQYRSCNFNLASTGTDKVYIGKLLDYVYHMWWPRILGDFFCKPIPWRTLVLIQALQIFCSIHFFHFFVMFSAIFIKKCISMQKYHMSIITN